MLASIFVGLIVYGFVLFVRAPDAEVDGAPSPAQVLTICPDDT